MTDPSHSTEAVPRFALWASNPENFEFVRMLLAARRALRRVRPSRKPRLATLVKRAEKTGKTVTSITLPDGTTINFGEPHADTVTPLEQWRKRRGQS